MKKILGLVFIAALASGCAYDRDGRIVFFPQGDSRETAKGSGASDGKVTVCHKGKKTMELPREALDAHLKHGDHRGPC